MRRITILCLAGLLPLLAACASQPIRLAPVGPSPLSARAPLGDTGRLQVFSDPEPIAEGDNPAVYLPSDYRVYDARGVCVRHVFNAVGYYSSSPQLVALPPGSYTIKARAKDYLAVSVPVLIERDRITRIHLDENWTPSRGTPQSGLVSIPGGYPVGWRAQPTAAQTNG